MLLSVKSLVKSYRIPGQPPIDVLKGISFDVSPGERVAIVGRSGAGKSTLLNLLGGLDKPDQGSVTLDGRKITGSVRASKIGFVFQSYNLMPELDVLENVTLPARSFRAPVGLAAAKKRALELLEKVGLADRAHHLPAELSGGEQQRVALARALVCGPELILADEPTGNLDSLTGADIMRLLVELSSGTNLALVMVTHSAEAAAACSRVLRLEAGKLV